MAVENEIQAELQESEVSDDEYLDCANWWVWFLFANESWAYGIIIGAGHDSILVAYNITYQV